VKSKGNNVKKPTTAEAVDTLREKIAALYAERAGLESQQRSREEVREHLVEYVEKCHADGLQHLRDSLIALADGAHRIDPIPAPVTPPMPTMPPLAAVGPALAILMGKEQLLSTLCRNLEEAVPEGVSRAERRTRIAKINTELDTLEAEEESLIERSEELGDPIARRPDARPDVILGRRDAPVYRKHPTLYNAGTEPARRSRSTVESTYVNSKTPL
jgi:hypothetical protein